METSIFLTENNKQVLEDAKDLNLIEGVYNLKKNVKQEFDNCRKRNRERLDDFRASLVEERVNEYFEKL